MTPDVAIDRWLGLALMVAAVYGFALPHGSRCLIQISNLHFLQQSTQERHPPLVVAKHFASK